MNVLEIKKDYKYGLENAGNYTHSLLEIDFNSSNKVFES